MSDASISPVEVRAPRGASVMEIDWADGTTSRYTTELLRGFCPSAEWQGHGGPLRFIEGGQTELLDIEEVGEYALRLVWPDCSTGLYSFQLLRQLGDAAAEGQDPRTLTFSHG